MCEVLFIEPKANRKFYKNPMHLQYLAGYIKNNTNINFCLLDLNIKDDIQALDKIIPNIIIISTPYDAVASIKEVVNKFNSSVFIFTGEIVTDGLVNDFLSIFSKKNIIAIPSFSEKALLQEIKSILNINTEIVYQANIFSENIFFTKNIIKAYNDNGFQLFIHGISRGCEEKCTFCRLNNSKETSGVVNNLNYRSTLNTISNLRYTSQKDLYIQFADENFFGGKETSDKEIRLQQISEFSRSISSDLNISFGIDTRIDTIVNIQDSDKLRKLRNSAWNEFTTVGLKYVFIGIESVSTSQIKRYSKKFNTNEIINSITFLNKINLDYTLGLIIFDPLTSIEEIQENINFVKKYNLYSNMASLLKEIRIQVKSPYYKLFQSKGNSKDIIHDYLYCNEESIQYTDTRVQKIIPIIRRLSKIFRNSGYRHSDISRIYTLTSKNSAFDKIPALTIKLEINIIELLILDKNDNLKQMIDINKLISKYIDEIMLILIKNKGFSFNEKQIHKYYSSVFKQIVSMLPI